MYGFSDLLVLPKMVAQALHVAAVDLERFRVYLASKAKQFALRRGDFGFVESIGGDGLHRLDARALHGQEKSVAVETVRAGVKTGDIRCNHLFLAAYQRTVAEEKGRTHVDQ